MLKWPVRAAVAIRRLFEPLQDIDVYVEDTNDEVFYKFLLNNAANDVTVSRVFGLGGRTAVLRMAASYGNQTRPALFIVDGDLSWVRGESLPKLRGLHRHDAYCIENLLLCEQALITIVSQEINVTQDEAKRRLALLRWRESIKVPLTELFAAFATLQECDPTVPTVSQGVGAMCVRRGPSSKKYDEIEPAKVRQAREQALDAAKMKRDAEAVAARYQEIVTRISNLPDPLRAVSGKDYLLPLIHFHLRALGCRVKRTSLRNRLAGAGDARRFAPLANALRGAARGAQ